MEETLKQRIDCWLAEHSIQISEDKYRLMLNGVSSAVEHILDDAISDSYTNIQ